MDLVLINLISAGFSKLSIGLAGQDAGSVAWRPEGDALVRELSAAAPVATNGLITRCVKDIWDSCQAVGLPADIAEPHLDFLTTIINGTEINAGGLTAEECASIVAGGPSALSVARDIAERLVAERQLIDPPAIEGLEIDATVLEYLATSLFESFATSSEWLKELIAAIEAMTPPAEAENVAPPEPAPLASKAAATLAKIERADALGISVPLLENLTVCLINRTRSADIRHDDLMIAARHAKSIVVLLEQLREQPAVGIGDVETAIGHYTGGRLAECDRALAMLEESTVERSITAMTDASVTQLAIAVRSVRAELQIFQGAYHKAARHFGFAQRYLPRANAEARWQLAAREAHFYEVAAYQDKVPSYLDQAARACSSAIATMPIDQPSALLASAQTVLARLLIIIGERDQAVERFEIAAQLLTDAQETFATLTLVGDQATVAAFRAGALARLGELTDKTDLQEQAAWVVQSALQMTDDDCESVLPPALSDDAGTDLELQLALAVAAFALRTGSVGLLGQATSSIEEKLPTLIEQHTRFDETGYAVSLVLARCYRVLGAKLQTVDKADEAKECIRKLSDAYMKAGFKVLAERVLATSGGSPPVASTADAA